jgi:hypothetical protein
LTLLLNAKVSDRDIVLNDPVNFIDPLGLDVWRQNRAFQSDRPKGFATRAPLTHTFVFTTNPDGSLKDTYSWGNKKSLDGTLGWFKNEDVDRNAAKQAIKDMYVRGYFYGEDSFNKFLEQAYYILNNDPNSIHSWETDNNCKTEADKLLDLALYLQRQSMTKFLPK